MTNPRETALLALYDIDKNGAYSNIALKKKLSQSDLAGADKALTVNLVYGVIKRRITIDYIISRYSKTKLKKISCYILNILRMGVYQIYFMDRIPDPAAVNESVKLAKKYGRASSGFVNGILHSVIRGRDNLEYPEDKLEKLSIVYSFPIWMCEKFIELFGIDRAKSLMQSMNTDPKTVIRVNTLLTDRNSLMENLIATGIDARPLELCDEALEVSGFDIGRNDMYLEGMFIAQDTAAMMASKVLSPKPGDVVIDLCAAPGGKTTHIAQLMKNKGKVIAFDIHSHKIKLITENAERMKVNTIEAKQGDSTVFMEELAESADKILLDAPCSGWGIIRRKPDIKLNSKAYTELPDIQQKMLINAAKYLKPGGELVYSTCTINPDENENVLSEFLDKNENFEAVDFTAGKYRSENGCLTLYPDIHGTDGFFIGKIKRKL